MALLSVILPAYNASRHIEKALKSLFAGFNPASGWEIEVIVVDDGSSDREALTNICRRFPEVRVLHHAENRGMCAARNTGYAETKGDYATIMDADDEFASEWFKNFLDILAEWPLQAQVCWTPCLNDAGELTCSCMNYRGLMTAEDMALDRYSGEYNPIFRGSYIRKRGYTDLGTQKSCGAVTYLRMAREGAFWITDKVMRLYHENADQSVTQGWTSPEKAKESHLCFSTVLAEHGDFIRSVSERKYMQLIYKILVYRMLSGQGRDFKAWLRNLSFQNLGNWLATGLLLSVGAKRTAFLLLAAKRLSLLRKYG